ncbi:MAG: efflux RND transporter periplasmic adaptor subunit [Gammaproteobacteria bacterium]|nr:efflux RND transporter periplasmic adaptor subunit [Gammaproteobacteria bacterium]
MRTSNSWLGVAIGVALILGIGIGYWSAWHSSAKLFEATPTPHNARTVLYWYDPMVPTQRFDRPGKSPFMDMALVPKYADDEQDSAEKGNLRIDPVVAQNLGVRVVTVRTGNLSREIIASGQLAFNARDVAIVQTRTAGYVERVYARAPGDEIAEGAPLADLLVPEWLAAQQELLALYALGDSSLSAAARSRLQRLGMPSALIDTVVATGKTQPVLTIGAPLTGVLTTLEVRAGMSLGAGVTLATITGLDPMWLEIAVPETAAEAVEVGQVVRAELAAFPATPLNGTIAAILASTDPATRTLRVRIELPNRERRLKAGMSARVMIASTNSEPAVLVPSEAVIRTGTRTLVMREESAGHFRAVSIQLGHEGASEIEVSTGLQAGDRIVASGQFLFDSEASLRGQVDVETPP